MTEHRDDEGRLRDLLEQAAPRDPDVTPGVRTTRVVRRARAARTRDRLLVGGAAAAMLAAAVAVPLSLRGGDEPEVATPAPATEPVVCPAEPIAVDTLPAPTEPVGAAASARACPATFATYTPMPRDDLPTDVLVDADAEAFVADVLALPAYVLPDECAATMVMPEPWAIVVGNLDGSTVTIGSSVRLCGGVVVDGVERDPAAVIAAFETHAG